jgi:predicted dehydrogenase
MQSLEKAGVLKVVGLFDPNPASVVRVHSMFSSACRLDDLSGLSPRSAELAIIASPPEFHAEQTIQLLRTGLSVLCEKPMATSVTDAEAMIGSVIDTGGVLAIGLCRRFFPAIQTIREILANRMIGDIVRFSFNEGTDFRWPVMSLDYFRKGATRGGVLLDIGVHALDLVTWWWGEPDEIAYEDDAMGGIEANCHIRVRFAQGFAGEIRLSRDWRLSNEYLIYGTKGWLRWQVNEADRVEIGTNGSYYTMNSQLLRKDLSKSAPAANFYQSFLEQLRNVIAAVRTRERPFVSCEDGLPSVRLVDRCYRQRNLISMPWLSGTEQKRARDLAEIR